MITSHDRSCRFPTAVNFFFSRRLLLLDKSICADTLVVPSFSFTSICVLLKSIPSLVCPKWFLHFGRLALKVISRGFRSCWSSHLVLISKLRVSMIFPRCHTRRCCGLTRSFARFHRYHPTYRGSEEWPRRNCKISDRQRSVMPDTYAASSC